MKWSFLFLFMSLFGIKYPIDFISCEDNIQIYYQQQPQLLELFNVEIVNQKEVCRILENSQQLEIEFEPHIQQNNQLSAWVFVDGELLQQLLVEKNLATITRDNPLYTYKLEKSEKTVSASLQEPIAVHRDRGYAVVFFTFLLWILAMIFAKNVKY